jgi:Rhodopirellula transposase DDE domain
VCHLPPGTSKWNKNRTPVVLPDFDELARQTADSHEVIVETIAATTTCTGLTVHAELDTSSYPTGTKVSDQEMDELETTAITRHEFHPEWNYTIHPPGMTHPKEPK